jgi:succinate-semialdehyde dehydrogenase/glutarate-semialdehyde dehydrogenase
MQESTN